MIRIIIADDHELFRAGLKRLIESEDDFEVIGEAPDGNQLLELCARTLPDIILLDLDMPGVDGLEAIPGIKAISENINILVLTMHDNEDYAIRALDIGAKGFILKASPADVLPNAIRMVASGRTYVTPSISFKISARTKGTSSKTSLDVLSSRERQVLSELAAGKQLSDIAATMSLSVSTVSTYKRRIMAKLGLSSNMDLAKFAFQRSLSVKNL
jgi:two-component system, NarL family, invasion response regulator UvrY